MRILLVEDEPRMARVIARGLREHAYAVDVCGDGEAALYQAAINDYDLIILDCLLPGRDGFEICRELRARGQTLPILMLTARATVDDRIAGLDSGADDYLTKPFAFRELLLGTVNWGHLLLTSVSCVLYAAVVLKIAIALFSREAVIFRT